VAVAVALSTGELSSPGRLRPKEGERLLRLQRSLARARPGSNRRARTRAAIARLKAREGDRRRDWIEKTSTDLAARFEVIRVEDLNVKGMTRSAKGTLDAPGRHVRAKAGLKRAILAQGWGRLVTRLEQKAPGRVEKVNAARNIAAGHAVTARGDRGGPARSVKRERQHVRPSKVAELESRPSRAGRMSSPAY